MQSQAKVTLSQGPISSTQKGPQENVTTKFNHFEFWPAWTIHFPMYLLGIYWGIRLRTPNFFPAVNPGMGNGGLFNYSKFESMRDFAEENVPKSIRCTPPHLASSVLAKAGQHQITFPMILKPDIGERGRGVKLIGNFQALEDYLEIFQNESVVVQEYISKAEEYGVFVIKNPETGRLKITSITQKIPLQVTGNGRDTALTLAKNHPRASRYLSEVPSELWDKVPEKNRIFPLSIKGNHCKGATFLDRSDLLNPKVREAFEKICKPLHGFWYGRLDVKVSSALGLETPAEITVLEVNGANSEPIHIYSPGKTYLKSLGVIRAHFEEMATIARFHLKSMPIKPGLLELKSQLQTYNRLKKETNE